MCPNELCRWWWARGRSTMSVRCGKGVLCVFLVSDIVNWRLDLRGLWGEKWHTYGLIFHKHKNSVKNNKIFCFFYSRSFCWYFIMLYFMIWKKATMREILVKYEIIFVGVSFTINTTLHLMDYVGSCHIYFRMRNMKPQHINCILKIVVEMYTIR